MRAADAFGTRLMKILKAKKKEMRIVRIHEGMKNEGEKRRAHSFCEGMMGGKRGRVEVSQNEGGGREGRRGRGRRQKRRREGGRKEETGRREVGGGG